MSDCYIKVKRKGFNYYADYMERYFDKVAVQYGYHLVKNPSQAEFACVTFIDAPYTGHCGSKWMLFASKVFNELPRDQLLGLSQSIAEHFKSEIEIEESGMSEILESLKNCSHQYGMPHWWYFSKTHNAFEEPPFLTEGETVLRADSYSIFCRDGDSFLLRLQNYGGISEGLIIIISFDTSTEEDIELHDLVVLRPKGKHGLMDISLLEANRTVIGNKTIYAVELPEFIIPEGINEYSAKLCGQKKHDESFVRSFSLRFIPRGNNTVLSSLQIEVIPIAYPTQGAIIALNKHTLQASCATEFPFL